MFGYVKPLAGQLLVCEYDSYRAVYCGLCKALGKAFGPFARLTLSYDFVAVALLHMAVVETEATYQSFRCGLNPFKKRSLCLCPDSLDFAAACAMAMLYYKLTDDLQDERGFKRIGTWLLLPLAKRGKRKAEKTYPEFVRIAGEIMTRQNKIEANPSVGIDMAADPSASALGQICALMSEEPAKSAALYDFGYMLGRWVYLIDAADDLKEDIRRKRFNPFIHLMQKKPEERSAEITAILNLCVTETAGRFEKLELAKDRSILQNIVYLGLAAQQKRVLAPGNAENCKMATE